MAGGPPDLVDCERLAEYRETLERHYELSQLPRLQDLLADRQGRLKAEFGFSRAPSGRSGALIRIEATLRLVCQRCLQGFDYPVAARSEEELLLALPLVPACTAPRECGRAPRLGAEPAAQAGAQETVRPFAALQDLLKK